MRPATRYAINDLDRYKAARSLLIVAVILLVSLVLGATGLLDDDAAFIVQILRLVFEVLVTLINLFVRLINMLVGWLRSVG